MSIRADSHVNWSMYFDELPEPHVIHTVFERVTDAIKIILEDMEIGRSHIKVECPIGYEIRSFYGMEDEEVYGLDEDDNGEPSA